jgi:hypothetical protein
VRHQPGARTQNRRPAGEVSHGAYLRRPKLADDIATHLLAEDSREFAAGDRLKYAIAVSTRFSVRESGWRRGPPIARWIASANCLRVPQMPAAGRDGEVIGAAAQLSADVSDGQVEIAVKRAPAGPSAIAMAPPGRGTELPPARSTVSKRERIEAGWPRRRGDSVYVSPGPL